MGILLFQTIALTAVTIEAKRLEVVELIASTARPWNQVIHFQPHSDAIRAAKNTCEAITLENKKTRSQRQRLSDPLFKNAINNVRFLHLIRCEVSSENERFSPSTEAFDYRIARDRNAVFPEVST